MAVQSDTFTNLAGNGQPAFPFGIIVSSGQGLDCDSIANHAGSGPTNFPQGMTVPTGQGTGTKAFNVYSGFFTPTLVSVLFGTATVTFPSAWSFLVVGQVVTVFGTASVSSASSSDLGVVLSIPISRVTNFGSLGDGLGGHVGLPGVTNATGTVIGRSGTNNELQAEINAGVVANGAWVFHFSYTLT